MLFLLLMQTDAVTLTLSLLPFLPTNAYMRLRVTREDIDFKVEF